MTTLTVRLLESWTVQDRWWADEPIVREYADVDWHGRRVVMVRAPNLDPIWRIYQPTPRQ